MDNISKLELMEYYFDWIKDETNNPTLTGNEGGVKLALKLLSQLDPHEILDHQVIAAESIEGLSQTFKTNEDGIPLKVLKWISPYYMVGTI